MVSYIQSGLSSAYVEAGKEIISKGRYDGIPYKLFNPNTNQVNLSNLVDGGVFDNNGIDGLLRRKVKNIHLNIFPNTNIRSNKFMSYTNYFTSLFKVIQNMINMVFLNLVYDKKYINKCYIN